MNNIPEIPMDYILSLTAVRCENEMQAKKVLKEAALAGYIWRSGSQLVRFTNWLAFRADTVYIIRADSYGDKFVTVTFPMDAEDKGIKILEFEEFNKYIKTNIL